MRKYDIKNKRNIGIIIAVSLIIIIMFSFFIKKIIDTSKIQYIVPNNSVVFDKDKSLIHLQEEGVIKKKWNNEFYLIYKEKEYLIGNHGIVYNYDSGNIFLYGKYYEINQSEKISVTKEETIIKSSALTGFYKLADRKYLIIDKEIKSSDGALSTTDFLIVELDRLGNAALTNHKVNFKTLVPTTIKTARFSFDIANEILVYGKDNIDLKKIIGSTNEYKKEDLKPEEGDNGQGGSNSGNNSTNNGNANKPTIDDIKDKTKRTSVIAATSNINSISIDYVVYDPYNEYSNVYLELKKPNSNNISIINLSKTATNYTVGNLLPNSTYEMTFKYSYTDDQNNSKEEIFDQVKMTTKTPDVELKVIKSTNTKINYQIKTEDNYQITSADLVLYINDNKISTNTINNIKSEYNNFLNLTTASRGDVITLRLENINKDGNIINMNVYYKYIF